MSDMLGIQSMFDGEDLIKLSSRMVVNLFFAGIVIRLVYFRLYRDREHLFTCFLFNIITFSMCFLLRKVPIELGFALGLFAVFGILRYRTEPIRTRDLTYLFIVIGIGILNGVVNKKVSLSELLFVNGIITGFTAFIELMPSSRGSRTTPMLYDNISLLAPGKSEELIADLRGRTGLPVSRVEVKRYDLLRDAAEIVVTYERSR